MRNLQEVEQRWDETARKALMGRTIVGVSYMSRDEAEASYWSGRALVLQLDNGALLFPQSDDEGNNAGALYVQHPSGGMTLPVL
jgi:hypothetical protein